MHHHDIPRVRGSALPPAIWHHNRLGDRYHPPTNQPAVQRPRGGRFTHPVTTECRTWYGARRYHTEWSDWCHANGLPVRRWATFIHPTNDATFLLLRNAQHARALREQLPLDLAPHHSPLMAALFGQRIDFANLATLEVSGVYITPGALEALPSDFGTDHGPGLGTFTVPTIWYCEPAFRDGRTWHWRP